MAGNTFGTLFRLTTFGESHGVAIGGIIDGCPAGLKIDFSLIERQMQRRKPGQSDLTTARMESDEVEVLSGIYNTVTTGAPIGFLIRNKDHRPADYKELESVYRPSHADFTYQNKYGIRDPRGGGRSSARETVSRVFAGALAEQFLQLHGISCIAFVDSIGPVKMPSDDSPSSREMVDRSPVRCPHEKTSDEMVRYIQSLQAKGDSTGGTIQCVIRNVPVGLGEPVFNKLHAELGKAMLSINAVHGFEFGSGFKGSEMNGSDHNDAFYSNDQGMIQTLSNHSGGIQGGISNGMEIVFRVAFKPVSTIRMEQNTVNKKGDSVVIAAAGRHDVCVVPRAVAIVEAMTALVLTDYLLLNRSSRI